jgi:hypothetical protein
MSSEKCRNPDNLAILLLRQLQQDIILSAVETAPVEIRFAHEQSEKEFRQACHETVMSDEAHELAFASAKKRAVSATESCFAALPEEVKQTYKEIERRIQKLNHSILHSAAMRIHRGNDTVGRDEPQGNER